MHVLDPGFRRGDESDHLNTGAGSVFLSQYLCH
jgi:hypothetical protein